jgi:hypothetical protein
MRFEVLSESVVIGYSNLEAGDPAMGVAGGKFLPSPAYADIQPAVIAARNGLQSHLALTVRLVNSIELPARGGVVIEDYSTELGADDGLRVEVLGIGYPLYEELFPDHVAAYHAHFAPKHST